jgi:hypothetical protein
MPDCGKPGEKWIGRDMEGRGCDLIEVLYQHLPRTEENQNNLSKISIVLAEIGTEQLTSTI